MIFFPLSLLLRRDTSIPVGNGTSWALGLVGCLFSVCLIDGVKVGTTELVFSASVDKSDVPTSFSSSGILTTGSSSLVVGFFGLPFFDAEPASFFGDMANGWEGE